MTPTKTQSRSLPHTGLEHGRATIDYPTVDYPFTSVVRDALARLVLEDSGVEVADLHQVHSLANIETNIEKYRQFLFSIFRSDEFQEVYQSFGRWLIGRYFDQSALLQRTPTARIQLAHGGRSVSYHTDGWYGHGAAVTSFWVPLVDVWGSNSLQLSADENRSLEVIDSIERDRLDLSEINKRAASICRPVELTVGQAVCFASTMLHGTEVNDTPQTRVSFDFRIAADSASLGTKPQANYLTTGQLNGEAAAPDTPDFNKPRVALMYSGICRSVSAKSQLVLLSEYAKLNNISIAGSESEIVTMNHSPVLRHYLRNPHDNIALVLAFSVDLLPSDRALRQDLYDLAFAHSTEIIFAAEDISLATPADVEHIEQARS